MAKSKIPKDLERTISLSKRMKPEERLAAHFYHSRLIHQIYLAGVRYRKKRPPMAP